MKAAWVVGPSRNSSHDSLPWQKITVPHAAKHNRAERSGSRPRHHPMVLESRKKDGRYEASVTTGAALREATRPGDTSPRPKREGCDPGGRVSDNLRQR